MEYELSTIKESWIISQNLIDKLKLKPYQGGEGINLFGQDGNYYGLEDILCAFLDEAERIIDKKR